jgi:CubicO group peptidase (beta-lactamase class C family)
MVEVHGSCDSRFERVREAFASNFDQGLDVGASVAVTWRGEMVVDLWAGSANDNGSRAWERDTIVNVYSTTKTMTALCALLLADRGELDFYAPVAKYWPEFAQNGKGAIEVRHLMSHTAGLPGWDTRITTEDLYDWEKVTSLLAAQAPWWEAGTASGYHAITQGNLVGEVVRRISGKSVGQFLAEEIARPLDADFHIGLNASEDHRVADLIPPEEVAGALAATGDSVVARVFRWPTMNALDSRTRAWRAAEIPAANGHGNARSIAKIHTVLVNGGEAWGKRLLSPAGCDRIFEEQVNGTDLVLGTPLRHGIGFGLNNPEVPIGPNPRTCYWGGWGGSLALLDFDANLVVGYAMTKMNSTTTGDMRTVNLGAAVYESLANIQVPA